VNYLPKWLAPNVVTVSGFFFNLFNLILTTYYSGWKGGQDLPSWVPIACALAYTTYIIFDYTDGKQARRLNASSPLGLLVDHGTDACTTFYIVIVAGSLTYATEIYQYLLYYLPITLTFFLNTWEEYYVGELVLPEINGIAEGTLFTDIVFIMSALYGKKFYWKEIDLFGKIKLKMNDLTMISVFIAGSLFSIKSIFGVLKKVKSKKIFDALRTILIYPLFALAILSVSFLNDSIIVKEYPKFLILTFGFQFAKMMGILQLSHILGSPYKIYQPVFLIPLFTLIIHSFVYYFYSYSLLVSIDSLIISVFIWNFFSWAHFVYFCSDEICEILNIKRFSLGKRYNSRPSYEEIKSKNK
jgi:phosphatidylglycerophosphate synthase